MVEMVKEDSLSPTGEETAEKTIVVDEEGWINKKDITSVSKYEDNNLNNIDTDTQSIVEISFNGGSILLSAKEKEDRDKLYKTIKTWIYDKE